MPGPTDATRVLLSFGSWNGGFELALALRRDVYEKFGKLNEIDKPGDRGFCYVDGESLRGDPGTTYTYNATRDMNEMKNTKWDSFYFDAMKNCQTMILLITKEWLTSKWCWHELDMLVGLAEKHAAMKVIMVMWPDALAMLDSGVGITTRQDNATRSPSEFFDRLLKLSNGWLFPVSGTETIVGAIENKSNPDWKKFAPGAGGYVGTNNFSYGLSSTERDLLLANVRA